MFLTHLQQILFLILYIDCFVILFYFYQVIGQEVWMHLTRHSFRFTVVCFIDQTNFVKSLCLINLIIEPFLTVFSCFQDPQNTNSKLNYNTSALCDITDGDFLQQGVCLPQGICVRRRLNQHLSAPTSGLNMLQAYSDLIIINNK